MKTPPSTRFDNVTANRRRVLQALAILPAAGIGLVAASHVSGQDTDQATPAAGTESTPAASPAASPVAVTEVYMTPQLTFDPEEVTIQVGSTVRWINATAMPHTATGDPDQNPLNETNPEYVSLPEGAQPWGSELMQPGDEFEQTFTESGEYDYLCIPHVLSGMRGKIIVEAAE